MNRNQEGCLQLDDYLEGRLSQADQAVFIGHLSTCVACRTQVESTRELRAALEALQELDMPDDADLRTRIALDLSLRQSPIDQDVMDIEETAAFLGITVQELVNCMDEMPAFEVAGRIRFNRDRLIRWMASKERGLSWEMQQGKTRQQTNILTFRGGSFDEQFNRKANGGSV